MLTDRTSKRLAGIRTCISKGHKVKDVYPLLTSYPDLWLLAYSNIQGNAGALTPGITQQTVDGFSEGQVEAIRERLKTKTYKPHPVRRVKIPKPNGKVRPLGIPAWEDKLTQEMARIILETLYEPIFKESSHGFRKGRSCHTALTQVRHTWEGVKWIVAIDIKSYFDTINHQVLLSLSAKRIEDKAFLKLIGLWLKAGYLEQWTYHKTYSGVPQGGIVSPILANVYLHELDEYMETCKKAFDRGKRRKKSKGYAILDAQISRARNRLKELLMLKAKGEPEHGGKALEQQIEAEKKAIKEVRKRKRKVSAGDPLDPNYRRLRYCRYADDFIIGIIGSKQDAMTIIEDVTRFLGNTLKLTVSEEKSEMNHHTDRTRFLGYDLSTWSGQKIRRVQRTITTTQIIGKITVNRPQKVRIPIRVVGDAKIRLSVPKDKIADFCRKHGIGNLQDPIHKVKARTYLLNRDDMEIMAQYNAELRGFAQYYALAQLAKKEMSKLSWYWEVSLMKTLAGKHKSSLAKLYAKLKVEGRPSLAYQLNGKAKWIKLYRICDLTPPTTRNPDTLPNIHIYGARTRLIERLQARQCEYCGSTQGRMEVHHIRKLKDLTGKPPWEQHMIARQRKTLVVCVTCHDLIHGGKLPSTGREIPP